MPVYFIQEDGGEAIKIGWTRDIKARLSYLQCGNPRPLKLLRECSGGRLEECFLHHHFAPRRIRGEWFSFTEEMLTIVPGQRNPTPRRAPGPVVELQGSLGEALRRFEDFIAKTGMSENQFCLQAVGNSRFLRDFRALRGSTRTWERAEAFIATYPGTVA